MLETTPPGAWERDSYNYNNPLWEIGKSIAMRDLQAI
jgi:hypothetical protein